MVANAEGTTPGAGWFADPAGSPYLRWWDGSQWTDNFIDAKTGAPPGELPAAPSAQSTAPEAVEAQGATEAAQPAEAAGVAPDAGGADIPQAAAAASTESAFAPGSPFAPVIPAVPVSEPTPAAMPADAGIPGADQTAAPQLTRRQARIMQEMEEARSNGTVAGAASPTDDVAAAGQQPVASQPVPVQQPLVPQPAVEPPLIPQAPVPSPAAEQPFAAQPVVAQPAVPLVPAAETPVHTPIVPPPTPAPAVQPQVVQEPVIVPVPTPPTPFDASTVAPPTTATSPTAWPFAAAPDATTAVPAPVVGGAAASAAPWLDAPAPSPDAMLPAEKPAYEPMARPRSQSGTAQEVFVGTTNNWAIWAFAALPILHLGIVWYIYTTLQPAFDSPIRWGVLLGPIVFYVLLAAVDLSILKRNGHVNLPSVLLAIIPLLYLGIRSARLGVRTLPPLVVWVVLQAAAVVALMFVFPTIYSQLTSATDTTATTVVGPVVASQSLTTAQRAAELTPSGMAGAITKQLAAKGVTLKSVTCPPLQSTQDAVTVTCVGSVDDGTSLDIVVAVDSNNKTSAFDIVSSGPAS